MTNSIHIDVRMGVRIAAFILFLFFSLMSQDLTVKVVHLAIAHIYVASIFAACDRMDTTKMMMEKIEDLRCSE